MDTPVITRNPDGTLSVDGAPVIRSEWANGELVLVTAKGEYGLPMTFEQFLATLEDA